MAGEASEISLLLQRASAGDEGAKRDLASQVYEQLHELAAAQMRRERSDHTLQATALVSEAWLRLMTHEQAAWGDRDEFFRYAARVMRNALVDHARKRRTQKRGEGRRREDFEVVLACFDEQALDLESFLDLQAALEHLEKVKPRAAQVVELRFFSGLTIEETARALQVATATVQSDFAAARLWLKHKLGQRGADDEPAEPGRGA